jgi:outer membrane protein OmpA-like peptidoglycan-associated protein
LFRAPAKENPMRTPHLFVRAAAALLVLSLTPAPVSAQFGGLGRLNDAARRAKEELEARTKKEEEAKAAEAKAKAEADAAARKEAEAKQAPPAPAAAPAAAAPGTAPATAAAAPPAADAPPSFQAFSKFDFVPGERIVAADDFTQDAIGDFPARWNTNATGEIVTLAGQPGRWLKLNRPGFFTPEFITALPEDLTLEFDFIVPPGATPGIGFSTALAELADLKQPAAWQSSANTLTFSAHPNTSEGVTNLITRQDSGASNSSNQLRTPQLSSKAGQPVHIALWRQRQRVRVYMNQDKVWDTPRALSATAKLNSIVFFFGGGCGNCEYYIGNLRLATGAPDTRNKVITEGKWVTRGILFDVNSDRIKPESYGSLKEIANVLTEAADIRVVIVGHTDSDGDTAANLDLSRRRAASVKTALVSEFKIDAARMDTDGKGEGEPVDKNETPAGKANNRRVEFIKK